MSRTQNNLSAAPLAARPTVGISSPDAKRRKDPVVLYGLTMTVSAFLLFQVQLLMSKFMLPRFGGEPAVWSTSLLVFQLMLLAGYGYAAFATAKWNSRLQGKIELALLAISALVTAWAVSYSRSPLLPLDTRAGSSEISPVWQIIALLLGSVGFQSILLSATSPLLQSWTSSTGLRNPYRLYALSNLGSMLGLLTYPVIIERYLSLSVQAWVWTAGYTVFLITAGTCAWLRTSEKAVKSPPMPRRQGRAKREVSPRMLWLAFAACSSMMLSATTNLICQQVAAIPLLWVVPLSLYLLSFIICFDHDRWYQRGLFLPIYAVLALVSLKTLPGYSNLPAGTLLLIFCSTLFAVCMVCNGELVRIKPRPEHLTRFYLWISVGGVLGSAFVALVAPYVFDRFWEFQIALLGTAVLAAAALVRDRSSWVYGLRHGWALLVLSLLGISVGSYVYTKQLTYFEGEGDILVWRARNFFGTKTVLRLPGGRFLVHGHVLHGSQNADPKTRNEPTTYYVRQSGIGLLLDHYPRTPGQGLRVGVIGMGVGTLTAYSQRGDYYRFYEIDPSVASLSTGTNPIFSFLQSSFCEGDIVLGDARLRMQEELAAGNPQMFDVLALDAFSGDAVPVHLLTREAMAIYRAHLRGPQSVIAVHISNTILDLRPVVDALVRDAGLRSIEVESTQGERPLWVLASQDQAPLSLPSLSSVGRPITVVRQIKVWSDDFGSIFELFAAGAFGNMDQHR